MPATLRVAAQADPVAAGVLLLHQRLERVVDEVQQLQRESKSLVVLTQRTDVQQVHEWSEDVSPPSLATGDHLQLKSVEEIAAPLAKEVQGFPWFEDTLTTDEEMSSPLPGQVAEAKREHLPGELCSPSLPTLTVLARDALDDDHADPPPRLRRNRSSFFSAQSNKEIEAWEQQRKKVVHKKASGFFIQDVLNHPKMRWLGMSQTTSGGTESRRVFRSVDNEGVKDSVLNGIMSASALRNSGGHYHPPGHFFGDVARSDIFQGLSFAVVLFSSIWIAFEIDADEETTVHIVMAQLFCVYFLIEMLINLLAFKVKRMAVREMSFMFDLLLVILIVLETWLLPAAYAIAGSDGVSNNMRIVTIFRLLRFLKVLRLAKVIRQLPELVIIIRGIVFAYKAISFTILLIGITIYAGALVFRVLLEGTEIGAARFASVPMAFMTLLVEATLSGSKGGILIVEATQEHLCYALLILAYVVVANITMMGIVSGLLVQAVKTVTEVEKAESSYTALFENLSDIWTLAISKDTDGDGLIDLSEFEDIINDEAVSRVLEKADVDVGSLRECSGFMFNEQASATGGKLTKKEFMQCVLPHRGKEVAKVKDHIQTRRYVYQQFVHTFRQHERRLSKRNAKWVVDPE